METTEKQAAVFALLENIQRADLNYFEEAAALQNLMVEWSLSQQELGEKDVYKRQAVRSLRAAVQKGASAFLTEFSLVAE